MIKILFVCLGNICRSPLAEAVFNHKVRELGLSNQLSSDSAGTSDYHIGDRPDSRTIEVAKAHQIQIAHYGKLFSSDMASAFDYIVAMDASNKSNIVKTLGSPSDKVLLMRQFDFLFPNTDVPDPYYGGTAGFEEVYQILNRSMDSLMAFLIEKHGLNPSQPS